MPYSASEPAAPIIVGVLQATVAAPRTRFPEGESYSESSVLIRRFRTAGTPVVLVRVAWAGGLTDGSSHHAVRPLLGVQEYLPGASLGSARHRVQPGDILISKRRGLILDAKLNLQSELRDVRTSILSSAAACLSKQHKAHRSWEHRFDMILVEDAHAGSSGQLRDVAINHTLPRIAGVAHSIGIVCSVV